MTQLTTLVAVDVLLKKLRTNRAKHLKAYETAKKGWAKLLEKELKTKLAVLAGDKVRGPDKHKSLSRIASQKPTHYLAYYDQAIEMLEFTLDETIALDAEQFQQYFKDEWNWKSSFTTSNSVYSAAARR